jgi:hypothetical protein
MNIFKVIGKLSYHTKKASTVAIQQPKKAWSDIKQGYENEKWADVPQCVPDTQEPKQREFDFGDLR